MKLYEALEKYEPKRLITAQFENRNGDCCALGAYCKVLGHPTRLETEVANLKEDNYQFVWEAFGGEEGAKAIYRANDNEFMDLSPEDRYTAMIEWAKGRDI